MKFIYNDQIYSKDLSKWKKQRKNCSGLHKEVRSFLKEKFPLDVILEEFPLPGTKPKLYADFFLPSLSLLVEAHGEQHFIYNSFFFKNKRAFYKARANDMKKEDWCIQNNIRIIALRSGEDWHGKF